MQVGQIPQKTPIREQLARMIRSLSCLIEAVKLCRFVPLGVNLRGRGSAGFRPGRRTCETTGITQLQGIAMTLDRRLRRLETRMPAPHELLPPIAIIDCNGFVADDGSAAIAPWVGRPPTSLPPGTQIIRGIDPRLVVGPAA